MRYVLKFGFAARIVYFRFGSARDGEVGSERVWNEWSGGGVRSRTIFDGDLCLDNLPD